MYESMCVFGVFVTILIGKEGRKEEKKGGRDGGRWNSIHFEK